MPKLIALLLLSLLLPLSATAHSPSDSASQLNLSFSSATQAMHVEWVHVKKSERRMYLMHGDEVIKKYRIALGKSPRGHKVQKGDQKTPEGHYTLSFVMEDSAFHRSMHIDYPNYQDIEHAERLGLDPGGNIKIHGVSNTDERDPQFIQSFDWTDGCIALSNHEMDEFIKLVEYGTPIFIEW